MLDQPILYLKYGELCLKGKNKRDFVSLLNHNLKHALIDFKQLEYQFYYDYILIKNASINNIDQIIFIIKQIPGFVYVSVSYQIDREVKLAIDLIKSYLDKYYLNQMLTFKIETKRSDKSYEYNSDSLKRMIATDLLKSNKMWTVDVNRPKLKIYLDVKKDCFLIYVDKIACTNGLPVSSSGKLLMLISGGIDSPVAARLLLNRGFNVDFISFISPPYTSDKVVDKIKKLIQIVNLDYRLQYKSKLYLCNFSNIQQELSHIHKESYRINLLRRSFFRISKQVCLLNGYQAIATGESLGQVASQTIESMKTINSAVGDFLVLRPLLTYNKEQIIKLSKEYGLYETSILPYEDSCSLFAPKNPVTKPKIEVSLHLEKQLDLLDQLESKAIEKLEVFTYELNDLLKK